MTVSLLQPWNVVSTTTINIIVLMLKANTKWLRGWRGEKKTSALRNSLSEPDFRMWTLPVTTSIHVPTQLHVKTRRVKMETNNKRWFPRRDAMRVLCPVRGLATSSPEVTTLLNSRPAGSSGLGNHWRHDLFALGIWGHTRRFWRHFQMPLLCVARHLSVRYCSLWQRVPFSLFAVSASVLAHDS